MFKTGIIFFISINLFTFSNGQNIDDAVRCYENDKLDSAIFIAREIIKSGNESADAYLIIGRSFVAKKHFEEAFPNLEKVLTLKDPPSYTIAWAHQELGWCYFSRGDYQKAKESFQKCYDMNVTSNSTKEAMRAIVRCGFYSLYDSWIVKESEHFIFHFQDTTVLKNMNAYIQSNEQAFDSINKFFNSKLPKKIDYFVWSVEKVAEDVLKQRLAFTNSPLCLTHTAMGHSLGHEMTHSISYFAVEDPKQNKLITEGTCVYFDLSKRNNIRALKKSNQTISTVEIWKGNVKAEENILYPLGGELVKRLIESEGREKFMELLKDRSYENAKNIYGEKLDEIINNIENEIK